MPCKACHPLSCGVPISSGGGARRRFKGVGKKTVACVLMFCLEREEFPVDTHVWRITRALGWVPAKASRDDAYSHLNARVPPDVRCRSRRAPCSSLFITVQLFMWQRNIVGVAPFIKDCCEVLGALDDAPDDASTSSSSALAAG